MHNRNRTSKEGNLGLLVTAMLFLVVLAVLLVGIFNFSSRADEDGINATRQAIERAAILCYATEGYYPPSLSYIEENYGVQVDHARYSVRYEVFASNIMPVVRVMPK